MTASRSNTNPFIETHPGDTLAHVAQGLAFLHEAFHSDVSGPEQLNETATSGLQSMLRGLQESVEHAAHTAGEGMNLSIVAGGQGR